MSGVYLLMVAQSVRKGRHDHIDNVNVPAKTMWMCCRDCGQWDPAPRGDSITTGVHMGGVNFNFNFVDGHASTFSMQPLVDLWYATGGVQHLSPENACVGQPYGNQAYTYPPEFNVSGQVAGADWWVLPWYPNAPIYNRQP